MKWRAGKRDVEKPDQVAAAAGDDGEAALLTEEQAAKIATPLRVYGWLLTIMGWVSLVSTVILALLLALMVFVGSDLSEIANTQLSAILSVVQIVVDLAVAFMQIRLGHALRKSLRRKAGSWAYRLIFFEIASLVLNYMLAGPSFSTVFGLVELGVILSLSVTIDPTLVAERHEKTQTAREQDRAAAKKGMLGRDLSGKGYLRLDFFNLFWMFFICCILGLVLEIIWHMTVVDPGVYEDRAGLLVGPFSPIYGFGAVLITLALNRLYKNPVVTFVVSGLVGGGFEWATAVFMKMSFGVTAWDYSDYTIFGVPDPVAGFTGGCTSTMFLVIWGILGLVWVKLFLPIMLKGVNMIPWKLRYGLTTVVAILMFANGLLTLGSLDCWFERSSGVQPSTPIEQFYATYCNDDFMKNRFQSMTMNTTESTRLDTAQKVASSETA